MTIGNDGSPMKYSNAHMARTKAIGTPTSNPPTKPNSSSVQGCKAKASNWVFQPQTAALTTMHPSRLSHVLRVAPLTALATPTTVISNAPTNTGNTFSHCGSPIGVETLAESSSSNQEENASPAAVPATAQPPI